jgi:serine/threonine-protein kinase mTOR
MLTTAEVLTELLKRTERLLKPYVPSLLKVCLPKAGIMYPYVSRRMIQCIGLLATISGDDVAPYFDEIMTLCLGVLQSPTAVLIKKEITLVTMGQVCANTSNVVDPYLKYPELFRILKGFLKEDYGDRTKRKVLQVMGILGALDPFTRRVRIVDFQTVLSS